MREGHAFALHRVDAERRGVKQHVHQVIGQKIDFIDVQNAAMRRGEQARLKHASPFAQRPLQIERAEDAVFRGADRQIDERHWQVMRRAFGCGAAVRTLRPAVGGIAVVRAADDGP